MKKQGHSQIVGLDMTASCHHTVCTLRGILQARSPHSERKSCTYGKAIVLMASAAEMSAENQFPTQQSLYFSVVSIHLPSFALLQKVKSLEL